MSERQKHIITIDENLYKDISNQINILESDKTVITKKINKFGKGIKYYLTRFDKLHELFSNELVELVNSYVRIEEEISVLYKKIPKFTLEIAYDLNNKPIYHTDSLLSLNDALNEKSINVEFIKDALNDLLKYNQNDKISELKKIKSNFGILSMFINEAVNIKIDAVYNEEMKLQNNPKIFISKIDPNLIINKKELAGLCGYGETWIHNNKEHFKQIPTGVYLQNFLVWLLNAKPKAFEVFKKNWLERLNTQKN